MDGHKTETEEMLYREYSGRLRQIEEKRDDIEKEIRQVDELWDETDATYSDVTRVFREIYEHCEDRQFYGMLEECEDRFREQYRDIERKLGEEKEVLEREKQRAYQDEDDIQRRWEEEKRELLNSNG